MVKSFILLFTCLIIGCAGGEKNLEQAGEQYQDTRSYSSLKSVAKNLSVGVSKDKVIKLLDEPDYSN